MKDERKTGEGSGLAASPHPSSFIPPPFVRPAAPEERGAALRLLLSHLDREERESRALAVQDLLFCGEVPAEGLLVLSSPAGGLRGAMLAAPVTGGGAVLWPPVLADDDADAARVMIEAGCVYVREQGARLIQSLLSPAHLTRAAHLLRNGFRQITVLVTLAHDLELTGPQRAVASRLTLEAYDPSAPEELHATLLRSYEATMDCPEITGVRTIDEVIAGHKAQGPFDPRNWWLARDGGRSVGVVVMVDNPTWEEREVAYIGIVPEARRRGHARELLVRALTEARRDGIRRVLLAVDERNEPAWRLYRRLGFEEVERQHVFLRLLP